MNVNFIRKTEIKKEKTILDVAKDLGVKIKAPCKGKGKCGKCIVKVLSGKVSDITDKEKEHLGKKISEGYRLACETYVQSDVDIELIK